MNNNLHEEYPDIEIYIYDTSAEQIIAWLDSIFTRIESVKTSNKGKTRTLIADNTGGIPASQVSIIIVENAKDNFTSVWFQSEHTPWSTDIECARSASSQFTSEIRCTAGSWNQEQLLDGWISLTAKNESSIIW